jgi:N-acetylglucosaminyl-diphospho-decaprenol L-rhamnosyltransferase
VPSIYSGLAPKETGPGHCHRERVRDGIGEAVRAGFPDITDVELTDNLGFGKANNLGFERASGDFILFLNPDTISNKEALWHCLDRLQADPAIGAISP